MPLSPSTPSTASTVSWSSTTSTLASPNTDITRPQPTHQRSSSQFDALSRRGSDIEMGSFNGQTNAFSHTRHESAELGDIATVNRSASWLMNKRRIAKFICAGGAITGAAAASIQLIATAIHLNNIQPLPSDDTTRAGFRNTIVTASGSILFTVLTFLLQQAGTRKN